MKRLAALLVMVALAIPIASVSAAGTRSVESIAINSAKITSTHVLWNPDVHNGSLGTVLLAGSPGRFTVPVPDGPGKFVEIAAAKTAAGIQSAVLVINTAPSGCEDGWAPLSYQAWWSDPGEDQFAGSEHIHINNLCWPVNDKVVNGSLTFSFEVELHGQQGRKLTRVRLKDYPGGTDRWACTPTRHDAGCPAIWPTPDAHGNLKAQFTATIDLAALSAGRHDFRWGAYVTDIGGADLQFISSRSAICVRACSPSARGPYQGTSAWYRNDAIGYTDIRDYSVIPVVGGPTPSWPASADPPSGTPATTPSPTPTLMPPPSVCA